MPTRRGLPRPWRPTASAGKYNFIARAYGPNEATMTGKWKLPNTVACLRESSKRTKAPHGGEWAAGEISTGSTATRVRTPICDVFCTRPIGISSSNRAKRFQNRCHSQPSGSRSICDIVPLGVRPRILDTGRYWGIPCIYSCKRFTRTDGCSRTSSPDLFQENFCKICKRCIAG